MAETPPPVDVLPLPLVDVLARLMDRPFSGKLRRVYQAAGRAILRLSDMDLIKYETTIIDASPDLSLWEEMAPVIRDTVIDVNGLLSVIREQFPENTPGGIADTLSQAVEEVGGSVGGTGHRAREAEKILQEAGRQLAQEVTRLGEQMRSPQVVSDRWSLLAEIQAFRSRFRQLMGDLVYASASAFVEVHRREVVPGYAEELAAAILIRSSVTDLARLMGARMDKLAEAEAEDVQWYAQQLGKDLDVFGKTPAYRALRAQDKRKIVEFRYEVRQMAEHPAPERDELVTLSGPFAAFVGSLSQVNNREVLVTHDREVWAACSVQLEQAEGSLAAEAATLLGKAVDRAQELYGRDPQLDAFLRKVRKTPPSRLTGAELTQELKHFRELLSNLPML